MRHFSQAKKLTNCKKNQPENVFLFCWSTHFVQSCTGNESVPATSYRVAGTPPSESRRWRVLTVAGANSVPTTRFTSKLDRAARFDTWGNFFFLLLISMKRRETFNIFFYFKKSPSNMKIFLTSSTFLQKSQHLLPRIGSRLARLATTSASSCEAAASMMGARRSTAARMTALIVGLVLLKRSRSKKPF